MSRAQQDRTLALLIREGDWMTAAMLADALAVTPRSVRSYITALNARTPSGSAIISGSHGYRAGPEAVAAQQHPAGNASGPRDRRHAVVRALLDSDDGIDISELAEELFVSDATIESDLAWVRTLVDGTGLSVSRPGNRARLDGSEQERRRLVSTLVHDEMDAGVFQPVGLSRILGDRSPDAETLRALKTEVVTELAARGYFVNEYGTSDVVLHAAIAADRAAQGQVLVEPATPLSEAGTDLAQMVSRVVENHLGVQLGGGDAAHIASLLLTRVVAADSPHAPEVPALEPDVERAVRSAVSAAAEQFQLPIDAEDFVLRLSLHVQNLVRRSQQEAWSRNLMTRSLKATYPMIFEVAVFIAARLHQDLGVAVHDDEVAYIAMHIGGRLEHSRRADQLLTATIVCPGYYEVHELLRSRVDRSLGQLIEVVDVEARVDPDWGAMDTDLVLSTIPSPLPAERVVPIQPFLTDADVERVQQAAARIRRSRRLARLRGELETYFDPRAFIRGLTAPEGEQGVIRQLGGMLTDLGVIDQDYVERAIEREQLSSTAFTDALAVPHAIGMTAERTAIAIGIADGSIPWGEQRVQVVAFVAFAQPDRAAFQTVFEQLIEVFSERESLQRILRHGTTFTSFLDELVAVIDG